ncbi:MAG: diaminopimelate decarboxylase [Bacteroidetes bacterium GWF2_33_16]|nr:MAG: diaminopimelate decarboxylase [Bacteroidetes bacterium GWE2_32_14]OFY05178.1 MAG: diaminopimelate decarboxylase [Bacteroidetes bacterium GWF2_33_16]
MFNQYTISQFRSLKTPFYYYNADLLNKTLAAIRSSAEFYNYKVHYAVKANANEKILRTISNNGFGADCVSGNEIEKAIQCGFDPKNIVFAGVGKGDDELQFAIENNIFSINCESIQELEVIDYFAGMLNKKASVALRVNPNIDAHTHHNITTGLTINKFGISENELYTILSNRELYKNLIINGLHFHIGSQITDNTVFVNLCNKINQIQKYIYEKNIYLPHLNVGGGLGINYESPINQIPDFGAYFSVFHNNLKLYKIQQVHFEPGRSVVGQSGSIITKVLYVKENSGRKTIICDAGFTELLRPALYQSSHKIINITSETGSSVYDVAGPICETSDYFAKDIIMPETNRGDLIAILSAGAYGEAMASQYNLRSLANNYFSNELEAYRLKSNLIPASVEPEFLQK